MNDSELDALMRQAQQPTDTVVAALDLRWGGQELLEEIMSTPISSHRGSADAEPVKSTDAELVDVGSAARPVELEVEPFTAGLSGPSRRRRRVLIGVAAAVAFAAAIAGPTIAFRGGDKVAVVPGVQSTPAPAVDGDKIRVLLDDPAWKISYVDEDNADNGEIRFSSGQGQLEVRWLAADQYQDLYADRMDVSKPLPFLLFGRDGAQFTYSATDFAVILPPEGKTILEIRGQVGNKAAFAALAAKLKQVSVDQWLAAMPASVVTPDRAAEVTKEMLTDVPLPPGYDASKVPTYGANHEYQFGAAVIGKVTCIWLSEYQKARTAGDKAGMATVAEALNTSRTWKTLQKMSAEGDYPEVLWEFTDKVAKGQAIGGYRSSLGCDD